MKFEFPVEPYSVQVQLAKEIYNLLDEKSTEQIGIFESPTGTGKTLSVLCGTLQWMLDQQSSATNLQDSTNDVPDWILQFKQTKQNDKTPSCSSDESDDEVQGRKRLKSILASEDRFLPIEYDSDQEKTKPQKTTGKRVKLIYCSRTHSQLSQVVQELKTTVYAKCFKLQVVGSRKQFCLNETLLRQKDSVQALNENCIELAREKENSKRCPYYSVEAGALDSNVMDNFAQTLLTQVRDIEDILALGTRNKICPYYGARRAIADADILLVPYNLVLQENARESIQIPLEKSIVVFDEAHNLNDAINGMYTVEMSLRDIAALYESFQRYYLRFQCKFSGKSTVSLKQILSILKALREFLTGYLSEADKKKIFTLNELLYALRIDNINLFKLIVYLKESKIGYKIASYFEEANEGRKLDCKTNTIHTFAMLLSTLCMPENVGKIFVNRVDPTDVELKFVSLYPGYHIEKLIEAKVHRILLVGGTMQPLDVVFKELFNFTQSSSIKTYIGGHIINQSSVFCAFLNNGLCNPKIPLNFVFSNRTNNELMDECGRSLVEICKIVPNGVVAFFTSYAYLDSLVKRWKEWGIWSKLIQPKDVFVEEKGTDFDLDAFLKQYARSSRKNERGALLLSVVGGKLSEGINFSDELARCVVIVGMPFPNANSPEFQERMSNFAGNSSAFLESVCMQSVNQSIGRAIRHKNDFAAIILMDERFNRISVVRKLPQWLNQNVRQFDSNGQFITSLRAFFVGK